MSNSNPLTITNISAVLKKIIVPTIQNLLPTESVFFSKVKKNAGVTVANNNIYIAARSGKHSGIYTVAEGTEPNTGKAKYVQPWTPVKFAFGTLELTDQAISAASKGDVKAIASILQTEITALKDDFRMDLNRQFHGDGSGILCKAAATNASTTLTLVNSSSPTGSDPTEYLTEGMYIDVGSNTAVQITAINNANTITVASAVTCSLNDVVTKTSAAEVMGLVGIIDDGTKLATIQNMARASNPLFKSIVDDTGAVLTEAQMINVYLQARRYGKPAVWLAGLNLFSKYGQLLTSLKKTVDLKEILSGGWTGLEFMDGVGVMLDFDTWSGFMQLVDFDSLTIAEMSEPFAWLEADAHGGILKRSSVNRTVWEGTLKYYLNLVGLKFKPNGRLSAKTAS